MRTDRKKLIKKGDKTREINPIVQWKKCQLFKLIDSTIYLYCFSECKFDLLKHCS